MSKEAVLQLLLDFVLEIFGILRAGRHVEVRLFKFIEAQELVLVWKAACLRLAIHLLILIFQFHELVEQIVDFFANILGLLDLFSGNFGSTLDQVIDSGWRD